MHPVKREATQPVRINSCGGTKIAFHSTPMGKVLLAWQDEKKIEGISNQIKLIGLTEKTTPDQKQFNRHLRMAKERSWALDGQENEPDIGYIAAQVRDITGSIISAISISG